MNLSDKKVLFYSHGGSHLYLALRLAQDFKEVLYYTPNRGLYPHPLQDYIGHGMGITVIHSFEDHKDEADLFVFPYTGDGDIQEDLRRDGKRVFGSGRLQELEQDRVKFKKTLTSRGLPTAPHKIFTGIESLRKISKEDPGWWIKLFGEESTYRGLTETFFLDTYPKSVNKLDQLSVALGPLRDIWQFMGERPLPGFETGSDRLFSGGVPLDLGTWGFELKNLAYVCRCVPVEKMPRLIKQVNDAMAPVWKKYGLCGALSDESRIPKDLKPYCVDLTPRFGSPPGEIISRLYKNISPAIWACAGGEQIKLEKIAEYAACINIKCPAAAKESVPLTVKEKDLERVMLKAACKIDGQIYNIPSRECDDDDEVATAIGFGDDLLEAQAEALENAEKIDAPGIWYPADVFDEIEDVLAKAEKVGLKGF